VGSLVEGPDGNFYGTTYEGGSNGTDNGGIVFKITPTGAYSIIHDFVAAAPTYDGQLPKAGLTLGTDGNFYGTTLKGGNAGGGANLPDHFLGDRKGHLQFLLRSPADGVLPDTPLVQHTNGVFYGTSAGNFTGWIRFFQLDMGLAPFVKLMTWTSAVGATAQILGQGLTGASAVSFSGGVAAKFDVRFRYLHDRDRSRGGTERSGDRPPPPPAN